MQILEPSVTLVRINCEKKAVCTMLKTRRQYNFLIRIIPIYIRTALLINKDNHAAILIQRTSRKFDDDRCQRPSKSCAKRDQEDTKHDINDIPG